MTNFFILADVGTLALFPLPIGLARPVVSWFRNRRYWQVLFRPIGTYWWTRLIGKVVVRSPFLLGLFTFGRIVRIFSTGGIFVGIGLVMVLLEAGFLELRELALSLVPIFPFLEEVMSTSVRAAEIISQSATTSLIWWKKIFWSALFIKTKFLTDPLYLAYSWLFWIWESVYFYITGMYSFIISTHQDVLVWGNRVEITVTDYTQPGNPTWTVVQPGDPLTCTQYLRTMFWEVYEINQNLINESYRSKIHYAWHDTHPEYVAHQDLVVANKPWLVPMCATILAGCGIFLAHSVATVGLQVITYMSS
jgi:hypothetical protein